MPLRTLTIAGLLATAALGVSACGGDDEPAPRPAAARAAAPAPDLPKRLDFVIVAVRDLDDARRFYTDALGWKAAGPASDGSALGVAGGVGINLVTTRSRRKPGRSADTAANPVGLDRIGFEVPDLDAARARLARLGVEAPSLEFKLPDGRLRRFSPFSDPSGTPLAIVEPLPG